MNNWHQHNCQQYIDPYSQFYPCFTPCIQPCIQQYPSSMNELSIYGDGSACDYTVSSTTDWTQIPPPNNNFMFMNFTVNTGVTLTVASGTIIRVKQNFVNNGSIIVQSPLPGESVILPDPSNEAVHNQKLVAANSLMTPYRYDKTTNVKVYGGTAYSESILVNLLKPGILGGGNGAVGAYHHTSTNFVPTQAGGGGGTLSIYVRYTFVNNGIISADGSNVVNTAVGGNGGGAGGIIIIASKQNIVNNGSINANGSDGSSGIIISSTSSSTSTKYAHAGGGGGGGLIHILSPNANSLININVNGGKSGTTTNLGDVDFGGGGGAMGGNGGDGGHGTLKATNGSPGVVILTQISSPENMLV